MTALRRAIDSAAALLAEAGIDSARFDAEELAAYVAGAERGRLTLIESIDDDFLVRYHDVVTARSRRVPLQHLTGTAAFGPVVLQVGPGVFIPRPETEAILEWAVAQRLPESPVIVDLCTGSGALAVTLARNWPAGRVIAVDDSDAALDYARRNVAGTAVELVRADVTNQGLLPELDARVDLIVANPPYVPDDVVLEPEVAWHDPPHAVFGGADGMAVIPALAGLAGRWLGPGGLFAVEHDDATSSQTVDAVATTGLFDDIQARQDLTGRPRFVTARRRGARG
ncbi:peptide chain release factor N(5)-glutamine methyltransferase [Mycobacterium sherrisii]|uniref:Release factor glutamine methyltransferase n=1 Tax=Mycobacterium sherrisii TaxID=243061 RepID=A0A1E3T3V4_9MYCO|nr:peptide chain release factor N(5)-glutamine methyltransferase [Mycobacterium sherrisii]MCV7030637.1 peptide chain release factor N(5)-glutamine methyltransferase [Mycobacterium sherrisii]MEC4762816.1 peptide chain release factor N(5)-glutamine methyltransferase [Mycobacterium sherrisii]ODR09039.1 protein-(glutamine-N5) methyltransferase, release factor-specific [Mycobacterium sherrisii]ORW77270.1 protein-(glutamine-N5) methyltransferase, release factor-specific [Mycobacterium sherrisii]